MLQRPKKSQQLVQRQQNPVYYSAKGDVRRNRLTSNNVVNVAAKLYVVARLTEGRVLPLLRHRPPGSGPEAQPLGSPYPKF